MTNAATNDTDLSAAGYAALVLRVALGIIFITHGLLKFIVFGLPGTAAFFASQGFPGWTAYIVAPLELVGGLLLVLGVYTRYISLALVPVTLGAITVHWANGWFFNNQNGGWEFVGFLVAALVVQALLGDGNLSLSSFWNSSKSATGTIASIPNL